MGLESLVLDISCVFDQIGHRQNSKWVNTDGLVVFSHIQKQPLFVGQLLVVVDSIVDFERLIQVVVALRLEVVDVLVSLPGGPYEVCVGEVLCVCWRPPISLLYLVFDHLEVIASANIVFLSVLQQLLLVLKFLPFLDEALLDPLFVFFGDGIQLVFFAP